VDDAPWQRLQPAATAGNDALFEIQTGSSGRFGVAWPSIATNELMVFQATTAEFSEVDLTTNRPFSIFDSPEPSGARSTLTLTPSGLAAGECVEFVGRGDSTPCATTPWSMTVATGAQDIVAVVYDAPGGTPVRFRLLRGVTFAAATDLAIDLSIETFAADPFDCTVAGGAVEGGLKLRTANGTSVSLCPEVLAVGTTSCFLPAGGLVQGDLLDLWLMDDHASIEEYYDPASARGGLYFDLSSVAPLTGATFSYLPSMQFGGLSYVPAAVSPGVTFYGAVLEATATGESSVGLVTPGWLGSATTWTLPDFSHLAGWDPAWSVPPGPALWQLAAMMISSPHSRPPQAGDRLHAAVVSGNVTLP